MCNCRNVEPQSKECYDRMITVEIPAHMELYKQGRLSSGLSSTISIDPCIFEEIQSLWLKGIVTYGSCCGHNIHESFVNVSNHNIDEMIEMGYIQNHTNINRKDTFKLKTV